MRAVFVVALVVVSGGCAGAADDGGDIEQGCCCASIVEGDILTEAPADSVAACAQREQGSCVDQETIAARLTPHPCCPQATGERCGD